MRWRKPLFFHSLSLRVLEIAQPDKNLERLLSQWGYSHLSRIDRAFISLPMHEARDFHWYSHVLGSGEKIHTERSCSCTCCHSWTDSGHQRKRIPSWMSRHPVVCPTLKQIKDDYQHPDDPLGVLADFYIILEKGRNAYCSRALTKDTWQFREPKCWPLRPRYELKDTDTSAHSCDVVERRKLLENALIRSLSNALTSTGLVRSLRASRVKISLNEKQK